jgi:SAM-dependent methyltransferase
MQLAGAGADLTCIVSSFGMLHHTSSAPRAFAEAGRVHRPGRRFVGSLYNKKLRLHGARPGQALHLSRVPMGLLARLALPDWVLETGGAAVPPLLTRRELERKPREAGCDHAAVTRRCPRSRRYKTSSAGAVERMLGWYLVHNAR